MRTQEEIRSEYFRGSEDSTREVLEVLLDIRDESVCHTQVLIEIRDLLQEANRVEVTGAPLQTENKQ